MEQHVGLVVSWALAMVVQVQMEWSVAWMVGHQDPRSGMVVLAAALQDEVYERPEEDRFFYAG